ncbi:MAG: hypothetical protein IVW54_21750 [Candidatus Binataceae bacterium]|nr:hypothetical protein [Candidatus Binataceae bacterium]
MTTNQELALTIFGAVTAVGVLSSLAVYLMIAMAWQEYRARRDRPEAGEAERPAGAQLIRRAIACKCPRCGRGAILKSWVAMNPVCPACGVTLWKNDGEWMGPAVIGFVAAIGAALYAWAILVYFDFSETTQVVVPCAAALVAAIGVMPWSHSLWTMFLFITNEGAVASAPGKP